MTMKKHNLVEIVVGIFVLVGLGAVFIMVMSIADQQHLFVESYHLNAKFRNVSGLKAGAPVFLSGVEAGTVESISFTTGGWVQVSLLLRKDYRLRIREDSLATIGSVGLLGDKSVEITVGSMETQALQNGDFLETVTPVGMAELLDGFSAVRDRLENILDNMVEITTGAVQDRIVLRRGLEEAADVLEKLNDGEGSMSMLLRDKALYGSLVSMVEDGGRTARALEDAATKSLPLVEDLGETARNIQMSSGKFPEIVESASRLLEASNLAMENLGQLADELKTVSGSLPEIVESIRKTADNVEEASRELPSASRSLRSMANEAGRVVEAAKGSWFLKGSFTEGEETLPVEVDGR